VSWRQRSAEVIANVIRENPTLTGQPLRKAISDAYPFGQKSNYPYTAWLAAVEDALGPSKKKLRAITEKQAQEADAVGQGVLL
jgi:hypothetical protein